MRNLFNFEVDPPPFSDDGRATESSPAYIRQLQEALNRESGIGLPLDGVMGFRTRRALRNFQRQKGLPADGLIRAATLRALFSNAPAKMGLKSEFDFNPGTEFEQFGEANGSIYETSIEPELSFGSPARTPRPVRANFVSCNPPSPAIRAITGPDPVAAIQAANTRAIELLDRVINQLQDLRARIRGGAATTIVPGAVSTALRLRFGINAADRTIWTGTGRRSVFVLIRRIRGSRQILADGWMKYTCLGGAVVNLKGCTPGSCDGDTRAMACGGNSRIVLCAPWWSSATAPLNLLDSRARTLLHECFHIYFGFIGDEGNLANSHCYDQFVLALNGMAIPTERLGSCA